MSWWQRVSVLRPELDELDDEVGECLVALNSALLRSEKHHAHWRPQSRLARIALKAIHWR